MEIWDASNLVKGYSVYTVSGRADGMRVWTGFTNLGYMMV